MDENANTPEKCVFNCDSGNKQKLVHSSLDTTSKLESCAIELLKDDILKNISIPRLSSGIEKGVCYHKNCWIKFTREHEAYKKIQTKGGPYQFAFDEAVDELVDRIHKTKSDHLSEPSLFKLSELTQTLQDRLNVLGYADHNVHKTRLKEALLSKVDGLRSELVGRDIVLLFNDDIKQLVKHYWAHTAEENVDNDDRMLRKAAMKLRCEVLVDNDHNFDGSLKNNFKHGNAVPAETIKFLNMVMYGDSYSTTSIAENLAALVKSNSKKVKRSESAANTRNVLSREQPLPLYCGLLLHASSHQKHLVNEFAHLGMSVSYNRVLEIETAITNKICDLYSEDNRICPPNLDLNVFTTSAIDNIDHNPSSNGATYSFHGTGISLIQHPTSTHLRTSQLTLTKHDFETKPIRLPQSYYKIDYFADGIGEVPLEEIKWNVGNLKLDPVNSIQEWLMSSDDLDSIISWASFHSRRSSPVTQPICNTNMLPLLKDNINSDSVVRHCLDIIIDSTSKINPTQTPVCNGDEPVYARIKTIQWLYPEKYGEDKLVAMLGGLHIEMSFIAVIGTWLTGSGWNEVIVKAGISTPGKTLGIFKGSHVKRCRYAHEVSLAALNILLRKAYDSDNDKVENEEFSAWVEGKRNAIPQFQYWITTMELEALLLLLVKSIREANFENFIEVLDQICPWYFLLDHVNYARWLPIFIRDMKMVRHKHPDIYVKFMAGFFTARKTSRKFSCMAQDQFHEQNNKLLKEHKSNMALLDKEASLVKWMLSGPEIARIIEDYNSQEKVTDDRHHEDTVSFNKTFSGHVKTLLDIFEEKDIFATKDITSVGNDRKVLNQAIGDRVLLAPQAAKDLYNVYVNDRILTTTKSIHDTIKQNRFLIFLATEKKEISKDKVKLQQSKTNVNDVCKMLLAHEIRGGDTKEFFHYENIAFPPSISEFGELRRTSTEEAFIDRLSKNLRHSNNDGRIDSTCLVIDGEELLSTFLSVKCSTFLEFSVAINKYIESLSTKYNRIDLVFGCYGKKSVQTSASVLLIDDNTTFPKGLANFLSNDFHKKQLSMYLAKKILLKFEDSPTEVVVAAEENVYTNNEAIDIGNISPCNHAESASRVVLHATHLSKNESSICIQTSKVLSVIMCIYAFGSGFSGLSSENQLFVQFKTGKKEKIIAIHEIYSEFADISGMLIFFYTFTGCKTVSAFHTIGKTKAFNTWMKHREVDVAFKALAELKTSNIDDVILEEIQRFVILMYDNKSKLTLVNDFRWDMFKRSTSIEKIPPTLDALQQHIKRTCFQSKVYLQCIQKEITSENPLDWGWKINQENIIQPLWMTKAISFERKTVITCKCSDNCKKKCKCHGNCTKLCDCEGSCRNCK